MHSKHSLTLVASVLACGLAFGGCESGGGPSRNAPSGAEVEDVAAGTYRDISQVTFSRGIDTYPAVSPDGTEVAYQRFQDKNYDIWVKPTVTRSDSPGRQVTVDPADDRRPAWHGTDRIVFDSLRLETSKIWRQPATGLGAPTLISRRPNADLDADVATDQTVVFVSIVVEPDALLKDEQGKLWTLFKEMPTIWRLDADGGLPMLAKGISPEWSPDGQRIAYASNESGSWDIYVMDRDGSNKQPLVSTPSVEVEPTWSPDGKWLAFTSDRGSPRSRADFNIWVVKADGSSPRQITSTQGYEGAPSWGLDARFPTGRIFFHAYRDRDWDIWGVAPVLDD